jgi:hypothetical protein
MLLLVVKGWKGGGGGGEMGVYTRLNTLLPKSDSLTDLHSVYLLCDYSYVNG